MHSQINQTVRRLPTWLALVAAGLTVLGASPSAAVESCKAKINAKDGTILVSAKSVTGALLWGNAPGQASNAFANAATCVTDGAASKCELGTAGQAQRITPPELCTVFLEDGAASTCSAFLKGCTPGVRAVGSGFVAKSGDVMTGTLRALQIDTAFGVPGCGAGDVCATSRLISQFGGAQIGGELTLEDGIRQPSNIAGVVKAGLVFQCDNSPSITRFFNTTGTGAFSIAGNGIINPGECVVTTPFPINNRFFSATGLSDAPVGIGDFLVTLDIVGTSQIRVRRSSETSGILNGENGPVSLLIY